MRSWWHNLWGGVKHDAESLWNALWGALDNVISWGEAWFDRVGRAMDWVWHFVTSIYAWTSRFVVSVWHAIDNVWKWTVHSFFPWVGRMFSDAYRWTSGSIGVVVRWAGRVWQDLWKWTKDSFRWVNDHVLAPLWNDVRGLGHWVAGSLFPLLWRWIKDVGHWAGRGFDYLFRHVADLVTWVNKHLAKWAPVLDKYAGFLLRWLTDPLGETYRIVESLLHRGSRSFVALFLDAASHYSGPVEDVIARFLSI